MSAKELASRLAHDVGKYVSRTARNLPEGQVPEVLIGMLIRDLYAIDGSRSASAAFEELAGPLEQLEGDARIGECRKMLVEIDGLEHEVRVGEDGALRRAAELALEIDGRLRAISRELSGAAP